MLKLARISPAFSFPIPFHSSSSSSASASALFKRLSSRCSSSQLLSSPFNKRRATISTVAMSSSVPYIQLDRADERGPQMPQLGLGTWKSESGVVGDVVKSAIGCGYRAIDCACDYGNEGEVGEGIQAALKENKDLKRSDLFITSKLWNTYHKKEHVKPALMKTLKDLQLDYLDLYLIHFPISLKYVPFDKRYPPEWIHDPESKTGQDTLMVEYVSVRETWMELESLVKDGYIRYIGVSNYPVSLIMEILSFCTVQPSVLQIELHPYLAQNEMLDFCKRHHIQVTAFSQFGPASYQQLNMDGGDNIFEEGIITELSEKHNKTKAQILLRWAIQRNTICIPKTSKLDRLEENKNIFDFKLSDDDMNEINSLDKHKRYNDPGKFCIDMAGISIPIYN